MLIRARRRRSAIVAIAVATLVTAANASQGAYFSQSWGWVALAFLVPVALALILGVVETPGPLRIAFAGLTAALGVWIALSAVWSLSPAASARETERMLVYVSLALALALVLRRGDATPLAAGIFGGVSLVCGYALATRLFQDVFDAHDAPGLPYRLSEPIGYWNSLGLLAVLGILLALGIAAHNQSSQPAALAAAVLPVLSCALYFTFSRGAWLALAVGMVAAIATDARRLRLLWTSLAVAPAPVVAVAIASRQPALTTEDAAAGAAVAQGQRLAVWLAILALVTVCLALGARQVSRLLPAGIRARRIASVALAVAASSAIGLAVVSLGGPSGAASELRQRFEAEPAVGGSDLNDRLFTISGSGRAEHLQVAWEAARERPVVGNGAGTYESFWYLLRPIDFHVRDAHSLYAEMLAEVGIVGVSLLVLALAVPALAAFRSRRSRVAPAAFGAYAAWAAHSALDWNWEVVGVTATALLAGGACLLAAERRRRGPLADAARMPLVACSVVLSVLAVVSLVGNQALHAGRDANRNKDRAAARDHARLAETLLPWSVEPLIVRGDAEAGLGDRAAALAAYRRAVSKDSENWVAWLRLAQVAQGTERGAAYARVRALNPLEKSLPGETTGRDP